MAKHEASVGGDLTPKQEAFALAYFETGNAAEAYRRAYDVAENAKDSWVYVEACQLLDHPKITLRDHSSALITRIIAEQRDVIRGALVSGMERGQNPMQTALDIVGRISRPSGRRVGGVIGLSAPQERTVAWVREGFRVNDEAALRRYLTLTRRDKRFDRLIMEAIRTGKMADADAKRISDRLADRYLKLRGDLIGRTESLASLNAGRNEAFQQAAEKAGIEGRFLTREWSATMDKHTRHSHMAMDGQKVVGLSGPFVSPTTGARLMFPGDSSLGAPAEEIIQCRCRVDLRVDWFRGRA